MKGVLKRIIEPLIVGVLFYFFFLFGLNAELISKNKILTWIAIIGGAILLYIFIFGVINNKENVGFGIIGFIIARVFFSVGLPVFLIFSKISNDIDKEKNQSLSEKENITLITNKLECLKIKYGTFFNGYDTITRFSRNNKDFETIKSVSGNTFYKIKWIDSCSYIRMVEKNHSVVGYVKFGNFNGQSYQMYTRPTTSHPVKEEKSETIIRLKKN